MTSPAASCPCGMLPAAGTITVACLREHIVTVTACQAAVDDYRHWAGHLTCTSCDCAGDYAYRPQVTFTPADGQPEVIQRAGKGFGCE